MPCVGSEILLLNKVSFRSSRILRWKKLHKNVIQLCFLKNISTWLCTNIVKRSISAYKISRKWRWLTEFYNNNIVVVIMKNIRLRSSKLYTTSAVNETTPIFCPIDGIDTFVRGTICGIKDESSCVPFLS